MCAGLDRDALIVIDDLPRLQSGDALAERLHQLVGAARTYGLHVLTLSAHELAASVRDRFDDATLLSRACPVFNDAEALDLLRAYGAPDAFLTSTQPRLVNAVTHGYPRLLVAAALYLTQHGWRATDEALMGLFSGDYMAPVEDEVAYRLLVTVTDDHSRDLLARLSLAGGSVSLDDMRALAGVPPPILQPHVRLQHLLGPWLQRDRSERLVVSPFIGEATRRDLLPETARACHAALGARIVGKGQIDPLDVSRAISHFLQADEADRAGLLLILALSQMRDITTIPRDTSLLHLWDESPLPQGMSLGIHLYLRAQQVATRRHFGLPHDRGIADLERLLPGAGADDAWAAVAAIAVVPDLPLQHIVHVLQLLPHARTASGQPLALPDDMYPEAALWLHTNTIATADQLHVWLDAVEQLPAEGRARVFAVPRADTACAALMVRIWVRSRATASDTLDALHGIAERAERLDLDLLRACATRAEVTLLGAALGDLAGAAHLAEAALAAAGSDPRVRFLLQEALGQQYLGAKQHEAAVEWLLKAVAEPTNAYPLYHLWALLGLSVAIESRDGEQALRYMREGVALARNSPDIGELEVVKAEGELAIIAGRIGDLETAYDACAHAADRLLSCRADADDWKALFVKIGHVTGNLASETYRHASQGGDETVAAGGDLHALLPRRLFLSDDAPFLARYNPGLDCYLYAQVAMFAEAVGDDDQAEAWAVRGIEVARQAQQALAVSELGTQLLPQRILAGHYAEALDEAVETCAVRMVIFKEKEAGHDHLRPGLDVEAVLGPPSNSSGETVEAHAIAAGFLPIVFRLATLAITDPDGRVGRAADLASLCEDQAARAYFSEPWAVAVELCREALGGMGSYRSVVARGDQATVLPYNALRAAYRLAATLQADVTPEQVLMDHIAVIDVVHRMYERPSGTYRRLVLPFLETYWEWAVQRSAMRLSMSPTLVQRDLAAARRVPADRRAAALLRVVAKGFGLSLPDSAQL